MYDDCSECSGSLIEELSAPANGYEKVVQENRKLYNMAQDLKGEFGTNRQICLSEFCMFPQIV